MVPVWVLALVVAMAVFVVWVVLANSALRWREERLAKTSAPDLPPLSPEELMEAQSLGLIQPTRPDPGRRSS